MLTHGEGDSYFLPAFLAFGARENLPSSHRRHVLCTPRIVLIIADSLPRSFCSRVAFDNRRFRRVGKGAVGVQDRVRRSH